MTFFFLSMSTLSQWIKFLKTATVRIPVFFLTVQKIRSMLSSFPVYLFCIIRTTLSGVRVLNTEEACALLKRKRVFPLIIFIFYLLIFWGENKIKRFYFYLSHNLQGLLNCYSLYANFNRYRIFSDTLNIFQLNQFVLNIDVYDELLPNAITHKT